MDKRCDKKEKAEGYLKVVSAMLIFGTIGLAVRGAALPSGFVAAARGALGALFMLVIMLLGRRRPSLSAIRQNILPLLLSGGFIGFNWILLFESYRYTTVATATAVYYMAPIFVVLLSPPVLGTRLSPGRLLAVLSAIIGMLLLSEVWTLDFGGGSYLGILLALGAAALYASVTLINKKMKDITAEDKTLVQLASAAVVVLPYTLICEELTPGMLTPHSVALLLLIGVLHTGIAYSLYFGSLGVLPADTVSVISYLDPIFAVAISVIFLEESMSPVAIIGAIVILASALVLERLPEGGKQK